MAENPIIHLRRNPTDWHIGSTFLDQLDHLHWDNIPGGTYQKENQYYIHGYIDCDVINGEIGHSCKHGAAPHHIKVCILKKDNDKDIFSQLLAIVGPKPDKKKAPSGADDQVG